MRATRGTAILAASVCLLAACGQKGGAPANAAAGKPGGAEAGAGGPAAGAAPAGSDQVIDFSAFPRPRPGQWRVTLDDGDGQPTTNMSCFSGRVPVMKKPPHCSQFTAKRTILGAYAVDMICSSPRMSIVYHGEVSGDFQSHASGDTTVTISMDGQPSRTTKSHTEMQYVGPCAPGQTPDDGANAAG